MNNKILLSIGVLLVVLGVFKPDISWITNTTNNNTPNQCVVDAPPETELLDKAKEIIDILKASDDSTRKSDCARLASLYCDLATLIELDGEDQVVQSTNTIREANSLSGKMLRLNIKDKYPNLAEVSKELIVSAIGDDEVLLDDVLRQKAAVAFRALSWAFYEGSK